MAACVISSNLLLLLIFLHIVVCIHVTPWFLLSVALGFTLDMEPVPPAWLLAIPVWVGLPLACIATWILFKKKYVTVDTCT